MESHSLCVCCNPSLSVLCFDSWSGRMWMLVHASPSVSPPHPFLSWQLDHKVYHIITKQYTKIQYVSESI